MTSGESAAGATERDDPGLRIRPAPVRKTVTVKAPPGRAFATFTGRMVSWWHPDHHIGKSPLKDVVVEPREGGRWYEVGEDGVVCEWGKVLVWEPPSRVVFAWQLNAEWTYDPDFVTELEIRFIPDSTGTRIELEHRDIERFSDKAATVRAALDSPGGWGGAVALFAAEVDRVHSPEPKGRTI